MSDLSPEAQELLRRARSAFSPSEGQLHAARSALKAQIGASLNSPPAGATSTSGGVGTPALGAAGWSTGHAVIAALAIGAIGAGAFVMRPLGHRASRAGTPSAETQPAGAPRLESVPPGHAAPIAAEPSVPEQVAPERAAPIAAEPVAAPEQAVPEHEAHEHAAPITTEPAPATTPPAAARVATRVRGKSESPREAATLATGMAIDSLAEEVQMLREARSALDRGDAVNALRLLDAHEARFRRATLHEERLATRVQALCALGAVDRARVVARELERVAPRSPHLARVRASCVAGSPSR
jgi:hypothetical protein